MKKVLIIFSAILLLFVPVVFANTEIIMNDSEITVNGEKVGTDENSDVYLTNKMNNGGLSEEETESNIEIKDIININEAGIYEFSETLTDGQISINANKIKGEVRIILNNANITCKNAPAIFVYSKSIENEDCKVIVELADNSINNITGGKIKTSVEGWENQEKILYYIDKGYDDDRKYYERYKYDGVISSDISLTFEGKGTLNLTSSAKEGIESKMNVTINDGTYNINSLDDGINACTDNKSVITINGGTVRVNILEEAEEGDGIDSNGYLYINGGLVYAFASPGSDNGLDSSTGTYINGGTVLSTGSMYEEFKTSNDTKIVQMQFSENISENDSVVIVDKDEKVVFAFKTDRKISTFAYSSEDLIEGEYTVYSGTDIEGNIDENGIYTEVTAVDLEKMTKQENNNSFRGGPKREKNDEKFGKKINEENKNQNEFMPNTNIGKIVLVILVIILVISIVMLIKLFKKK